jgi:microcin C transport system permease protein
MMLKAIGGILMCGAVCAGIGEWTGLNLPTLEWGFELSRNVKVFGELGWGELKLQFPWFGWLLTVISFFLGLYILIKFSREGALTPITVRKIERFKSIKRGYYSFLILIGLAAVAGLDHALVGSDALMVRYEDQLTFPAFSRSVEIGAQYGLEGDDALSSPDYRELKHKFKTEEKGDFVVMPLWPYASTGDNIPAVAETLEEADGVVTKVNGDPLDGLAARVFDVRHPENVHMRYRFRKGVRQGRVDGWDKDRNRVYEASYKDGKLVPGSRKWNGEGSVEDFLGWTPEQLHLVHYPPAPPNMKSSPRHPLGTNSQGYDVIAYLYGGLKVNFQAALLYIPLIYAVGVSVGLLMGYFGGTFDLVVQRIIEILSNIPFLFLVIIVSEAVPAHWKDRFGLYVILGILAMFGWMGMTYLMRTAALKEKARDYIAASRVLGASTPRILFRHLLPNSVAIVVTLIPFSVSGLVLSLTSLDYLGFGLPPKYATWGKLLRDGLDNISSPWLVTTAFMSLVVLLILVTFVGEAVREAFDPKKYTFYR